MTMVEDAELLRLYCTNRSEQAFTELVQRYLNLVYSAALRRTGDTHSASDVSQMVFAKLARHAASLSHHPVLTGWLYTTTRTTAIDHIRAERSRRTREENAHTMNDLTAPASAEVDWIRLRPVLDGAMDQLGEGDRTAILLRYFESRPFGEIGRALRLSEDSARKRVDRALKKLHKILASRGISSTTAALCLVLANQSIAAAPSGLVATVANSTLAGTTPEPPLGFWKSTGTVRMTLAATGLVIILAAGAIIFLGRTRFHGDNQVGASAAPSDPVEGSRKANNSDVSPANGAKAQAKSSTVPVWQATLPAFAASDYDRAVEAIISSYEQYTAHPLAPGSTKRVGLKIYTDSGPQLATPAPLVNAVIAALVRRGFEGENIFLVGLSQARLQQAGFLPAQGSGSTLFAGHPVYVLESGQYYRQGWYYNHPLPARYISGSAATQTGQAADTSTENMSGTSDLDVALASQTDFWINLPVYTDDPVLGVNGALLNATLCKATNTSRDLSTPVYGPAAAAEMGAIPELKATCVFTLASLQTYQYFGGRVFDSRYTASEPYLWLSGDPVMVDALMRDRINGMRHRNGLPAISDTIRTLEDAESIGVGSAHTSRAQMIAVEN